MQNCVLLINTALSPSFVSHGGTLTLVDISIRSSDHSSHDTPFLSSGLFSRFNLISSTFSNISTSLLANSMDGVWSDDVTDSGVIASSNFDRCDACCAGALYSGNRFRTLSTLNCSFSHFTLTNEVQQTLTATASFIGDVFESLTRNGEGGAIQFKPSDASAVLTVTNCAFTACTSSSSFNGGAIHASNGKVVVTATTFTECTGHSGGAIATIAAQLTVSDSAFYSCKAICQSWEIEKGDMSFFAEPWTPENERLNGGGGAMWIELQSSYYLLSACLFESCLAPSFGGGIVLWPYGCAAPTFFRMVNCMFLGTTVSTIKNGQSGGQNVMIACVRFPVNDIDGQNYFQTDFNNKDDPNLKSKRLDSLLTDSTNEGTTKNIQLGTSGYVYGSTVDFRDADVYVSTSGSNVWDCGDQSKQCKTVTYAGNKVTANYKVIVAAGTYSSSNGEETCIVVNAKTVRIEGAGSSSTSVSFIKPTFFQTANMKVTTGTLSVPAMSLTLNADTTDTWHLIEVDGGGSATLTNCILKGTGSAQNGRLVSIIGGSLAATGCEFNNIQSTLSTGAAIHADLTSSSTLTLSSSSFTNYKLGSASENVGAALFIHLQDNAKTYTLSGLTFAGGEANRAADIFISTPTLDKESEYLTEDHFKVTWQNNAADNLRFKCFSRDSSFKPQEWGIPLYFAGQTELFVNSSKSDAEDCGSQDAPCQSVTFAGSQMSLSGMTVFVMMYAYLKGTTDIAGCTIQPEHESDQATLQVTQVSSLTITDTTSATISRIDFAFGTPLSSSTALLSTSTGSFVLQSCSFKSSGSVVAAQTLISVSATGTITTDGLRVSDLSFSSPAIAIASSSISVGDVTFSTCSFTGPLPATLVSISPSSSCTLVSVGKVSFTSFSTTSSPSSSSELTLALISGPSTSTFTASTATLITSAAGSLTSNTVISFSGSSSSSVPLLKLSLCSIFSTTVSNTKVVFPSSTNAGSTAALAKTSSSSLSFSESTIDTSNLSGFFTSSFFIVPANTLSVSFSSLSPFLSGSSKVMSVPLARVTGGSLSLSKVKLDAAILSSSFAFSVIIQSAGKVDISESQFGSIASTLSGSAISATLGSGASLSLTSVTFTSCTSTADGGPLHVRVNRGTFSTSGTISFEGCSATGNGNCLYLSNSNLVSLLRGSLNSIKPSLPNNNALFADVQKKRYFGFESESSSGSLLYYWYPHTTSETSTHIHSSGEDHPLCGLVSLPCQSISTALTHPNSAVTFSIDSSLILSETITVSQTATLTSSSSTAITVTSTGFIVVTSNKLTLSNLAFTGPGTSTSQSFVTVSSTGSLSVSSCSFTSFSSSTNGGALNVVLTTGSFSLQSTTFKKCSSSLNGGAIWMDLVGMTSPSQYSLIDTVFGTGTDASHTDRSGHHVYVIAKDLSEVIVASRWAGSFDTAEDADLWGMDSESNEMSLLPILKSHVIAVGENGSDDDDGTFASPFRTLHRCLESTKGQAGPFTVEIVKKATIGRSCSLASEPSTTVHIRGSGSSGELLCSVSDESSESGTSISSGQTAMVSLSLQTLTFSQIVFSSFSAQRSIRFVFSLLSSSRLVLTSCSISSSTPLSVSLVSASSSSSFSAVALATSALSFVGKASLVVCGDQSRISIASSSFSSTSFDAGAFVWGSTRGDVSVEDTAFVGCSGREFGSLIRVKMAGCTTSIKKCRFVSCSTVLSLSERGGRRIVCGGCVLVEMARQTPVPRSLPPSCADLSLSSFTSCSLINTDLPHSLSSSSQFVGGSAFAIVSHDNSGLVKLPKVALSNCTCEHFAGDGVFDGGVVVGEGQHVRTDRRGCVVDKCRLGSIVLH
ncbi:hypothetical protein BLNAU_15381 [Blattamonas nauphoetae]|uniref:Uncharacterized protein n=1 Tax=Blattamonas nauphoetae TaxID=2049346 RepID=A0ABQ9XES0_9EUKA|nr:hypothetical protein BLNAU_15381 [Blattamonas nauphoetae]